MRKRLFVSAGLLLLTGLLALAIEPAALAQEPEPENGAVVALGKAMFFDTTLSVNGMQSCATCHGPEVGFTGPDSAVNAGGAVYHGAIIERFGNRKPPASAYGGESPILYYNEDEGEWMGGMFWDGRASGAILGDPLAEQAQGPFLNPLEQALPNARLLCVKVAQSSYAGLFEEVWGAGSLDCALNPDGAYERIGRSIAAYERSQEVNPFSSRFDQFWDNAQAAGKDVTQIRFPMGGMGGGGGGSTDPYRWQAYRGLGLADSELQGLAAFNDSRRADCSACHTLTPGAEGYPLFTDFSYHNLGLPKNPDNPFYTMPPKWNPDGSDWVDPGLGGYLKGSGYAPEVYNPEMGKFRTPSLRNVDLRPSPDFVKAYGHNGYFKSLAEIVHFYAWRGMMTSGCGGMGGGGMGGGGDCGCVDGVGMGCNLFPEPELPQNLAALKHFNMMDQANIVAFLQTLSDGYYQR